MKKGYEIHVLSDEEYNMLPYKYAKESQGMTIPAKNVSYVRSSGNPDIDRFFIDHEFDEAMQAYSDHEIDGVRYGFFDFIKNLFMNILFGAATPLISKGISAITGGGQQQQQAQPQVPQQPAFQASPVTAAFAPQTAKPLSQSAFNKSLADLDKNAMAQERDVFKLFRGRTPEGDTAFNRSLANTRQSSQLAKSSFLEDQRKLGSTFA